jgi:hypothetical protein
MSLKYLVALLLFARLVEAHPLTENHPHGRIDWQQRTIEATTTQGALQILGSLRIDSHRILGDMFRQDPSIQHRLMALAKRDNNQIRISMSGETGVLSTILSQCFIQELAPTYPSPSVVTQLVIDARGTDFYPCLMPKMISESGKMIRMPSPHYSTWKTGLVTYVTTMPTKTNTQIHIKALRATGPFRGTLVLSADNIGKLEQIESDSHPLQMGRLIIVR